MRRYAVPASAGLLFVGLAALAGSIQNTNDTTWGTYAQVNINDGTDINLALITDVDSGSDWYRHPWDGTFFAAELEHDDATWFTDRDRCLLGQTWAAAETLTANTNRYRGGTDLFNDSGTNYQPAVGSGVPLLLPSTMPTVSAVRFLTAGAKNGTSSYVVRFTYSDASFSDVTVPILQDTTDSGARNATGTNYQRFRWTGVTHTSNVAFDKNADATSDCKGNGADEVWVTNPAPGNAVDSITFTYTDYATATTTWLGGPLAVTVVTDDASYDATYTYDGTMDSGESQTLDAGGGALWYQLSWTATIPGNSALYAYISCSTSGNAGTFGVEQVVELGSVSSPYDLPLNCAGRYARYRLELVSDYATGPALNDITLWYDPDTDNDGYGIDGTATTVDCAPSNPAVNPGAAEIIGDEFDQNCDTDEECWRDNDNDGDRSNSQTILSTVNITCVGANEGRNADPIDCNDNNNAIHSAAVELPGDTVDQNCDGLELCYVDADGDGYRHATNTQGPQANLSCNTGTQELASAPVDCDDANPAVNGAGAEIPANDIDENCDGVDNCYRDNDNDGQGSTTVFTSNNIDCDVATAAASNNTDCNDANANIYSGATEIAANGIDENCDLKDDCWQDGDGDGFGRNTKIAGNDMDCSDAGESAYNTDCSDTNAQSFPGASINGTHVGDGADRDCDGREECYRNQDQDGFGSSTIVDDDGDGTCQSSDLESTVSGDCNDTVNTIYPGASEVTADSVDQDCNNVDNCYRDLDQDAYGTATVIVGTTLNCSAAGESRVATDCDDNASARFPGNVETIGNEVDNDCNGVEVCYADADNDNHRHASNVINSTLDQDCQDNGEAASSQTVDCDDNDNTQFVGNAEVIGNGVDNDCSGTETCYADMDNDDYRHTSNTVTSSADEDCLDSTEALSSQGVDCDDGRALTNPGATDTCGNGIDDDCDGNGDHATPGAGGYTDDDADSLTYAFELTLGTSDCDADHDNDGLDDDVEVTLGTTPTDADTDNDGATDGQETPNPLAPRNTDGDALIDARDSDDDNDGVPSINEDVDADGSPLDDDTDADLTPDYRDTDDDGDLVPTLNEDHNANGNWFDDDRDNDTRKDFRDADDDGDGLLTRYEDAVIVDSNPRNDQSDGDGVPDYLDNDDDNDGVLTSAEDRNGNGDVRDDNTDGDGLPNYRDADDDGDGIPTLTENTSPVGTNVDGDALPNYLDTDSDGDSLSDAFEGTTDTNSDGQPNYLDTDSDGDLVLDSLELALDSDADGISNRIDADDDGDGVPTAQEDVNGNGNPVSDDTDGDGTWDYLDQDDDNDTVPTLAEDTDADGNFFEHDTDADTRPDFRDNDDDGDGLLTRYEDPNNDGNPLNDNTDGTGRPDYRDADDDDDGVPTLNEDINADGDARNDDRDLDGTPNYRDIDDDGDAINTIVEIGQFASDVDGDGQPNYLDLDSDADTWTDLEETATDWDLDGKPDFVDDDSDADTVPDLQELHANTDGDTTVNRIDTDDDGDGIPTSTEEAAVVPDLDGVRNYLDLDSDQDTWSDAYEWAAAAADPDRDRDNDGNDDYVDTDADNDNVLDIDEEGSDTAPVNTDGDGFENRLDADDDGDNIPTDSEPTSGVSIGYDWDADGVDDYLDSDDDDDSVLTRNEDPNANSNPLDDDTDGDGSKNYHDIDDDGDGVDTIDESPDGDGDPRDDNTDGDGLANYLDDDDDGDGIDTAQEIAEDLFDEDGDATPNHLDQDSDNDGFTDAHEWTVGPSRPDFDGDGDPDYVDSDSDNDTVPDIWEEGGTNRNVPNKDTDGDGNENRVDTDDDGDRVPTAQEETELVDGNPRNDDWDNDGRPDYRDVDDDDDTVLSVNEDVDGNGDPRNDDTDLDGIRNWLDTDDDGDGELTATEDPNANANPLDDNTDGDARPNFLDLDDDQDGIATIIETAQFSRNVDGDGLPNHLDLDSDADNWADAHEWSVGPTRPDADQDGLPDFVDPDSDDDGILDSEEGTSTAPINTDGDTYENRVDPDDDGDKIPTDEEEWVLVDDDPRNDDYDGDGIDDYLDDDDDDDNVPTATEDVLNTGDPRDSDTDGDGIDNFLDTDDDDDTVLTINEDPNIDGRPANDNTDGDALANYLDDDDDGDTLDTATELDIFGFGPEGYDFDMDGWFNFLDADDDDDGVNTFCEVFYGVDYLRMDSDNDLISDGLEWSNWLNPTLPQADYNDRGGGLTGFDCLDPWDRDSDGVINALDFDDDGDGISTFEEGSSDWDCNWPTAVPRPDGIPNYLDYDSDNDTLLDDAAGDGTTNGDGLGDVDSDFLVDYLDCDNSGCTGDSDIDGIQNCDEYTNCPDTANPTSCAANPDVDGDGVIDGDELGNPANPNDTDGDGTLDPFDTDDDGDGVDTRTELGLECPSGEDWELRYDAALGWVHWCPTDDVDLLAPFQNTDEPSSGPWPLEDDLLPDYLDEDDDGDGRLTIDEADADDDDDGIVNYLDMNDFDGPAADPDQDGLSNQEEAALGLDGTSEDTDGDGIPDDQEIGDPSNPTDTDADGIIDAADDDDDGDGIPTSEEGDWDTDGDGTPNRLDDDSDGDGLADGQEGSQDGDCDGAPDRLDAVDDNLCTDGGSGLEVIEWTPGCGCSSAPTPAGWAWLAGLGLLAARRRRAA